MGGDLPKVTWESGAKSKPLILSQARVLMDSRPHYSEKYGAGRGRQAARTVPLFSGRGMVPIDRSMRAALNVQCVAQKLW